MGSLNPDTRVAVCCYAGDAHYVIENLLLFLHHECPVTVLSPTDSRADVRYDGVENVFGGKRAYIGQACLDRMLIHLKMLLERPETHFLIHDADSVCLAPDLPRCLYDEPDVLWSNLVHNGIPEQQRGFPAGVPHIALQPPWFMSRRTIERLLEAASDGVECNPVLPFIDFMLVELALKAGIEYRALPSAMSAPISHGLPAENARALRHVRDDGFIFMHAVKGAEHAAPLIAARAQYVYNQAGVHK